MKFTIDTDIIESEGISIGEFLVLLMAVNNIDYDKMCDKLINKELAMKNLFKSSLLIVSNEVKQWVTDVLVSSDEKLIECGIDDFEDLARKLQKCYPKGNKPQTTYPWRGTTEEIVQKLKSLVVLHDFRFNEEEAIEATKQYIESFDDYKYIKLLKNFLLKTTTDAQGNLEIDSMFMTTIENNRDENNNRLESMQEEGTDY